jgi:hypothetical protein
MNHALRTNTRRIAAALVLAGLAGAALAQTQTVRVDGLANCIDVFEANGPVNPVALDSIEPGTYSVKVKSSTVDFCGGTTCPHTNVALTIFADTYIDETFVISPKVTKVTFGSTFNLLRFYFPDSNCTDNIGHAVVQLTKM